MTVRPAVMASAALLVLTCSGAQAQSPVGLLSGSAELKPLVYDQRCSIPSYNLSDVGTSVSLYEARSDGSRALTIPYFSAEQRISAGGTRQFATFVGPC